MIAMPDFSREDQINFQSTALIKGELEVLVSRLRVAGMRFRGKKMDRTISLNALILALSGRPTEFEQLVRNGLELLGKEIDREIPGQFVKDSDPKMVPAKPPGIPKPKRGEP